MTSDNVCNLKPTNTHSNSLSHRFTYIKTVSGKTGKQNYLTCHNVTNVLCPMVFFMEKASVHVLLRINLVK